MQHEVLLQSIPNFSEGRNLQVIERLADCFRGKPGLKLLDYTSDPDHNRTVITILGTPEAVRDSLIASVGVAVERIDMTRHEGQHPRMGCVDVIPLVPVGSATMADANRIAHEVAQAAAEQFGQPFFLYERSATAPHRENLAEIRKGQFEGMAEKLLDPRWKPDYGPDTIHPTGGVTAIGARMPLIYYNINLGTPNVEIARRIAQEIRHINGGFRYIKAMGVALEERGITQVTINFVDYTQTAIYRVFETVKMEARRYGVPVLGSEVVGIIPMAALLGCAEYYLQLEDFSTEQVLESYL